MNEKDIEKLAMKRVSKVNYKDLNEFYKMLDSLEFGDEDKAIFVLSRYGVKLDKLNSVKWIDIDRENMIIYFENIQLPIDKTFLDVIDKLNNNNETVLDSNLTKEKIYNKTMIVCRDNNIPRISLAELAKNRIFDLLIDRYGKNNRLVYNDFKEVIDKIYGEKKLSMVALLVKSFEETMDIKVTKAI